MSARARERAASRRRIRTLTPRTAPVRKFELRSRGCVATVTSCRHAMAEFATCYGGPPSPAAAPPYTTQTPHPGAGIRTHTHPRVRNPAGTQALLIVSHTRQSNKKSAPVADWSGFTSAPPPGQHRVPTRQALLIAPRIQAPQLPRHGPREAYAKVWGLHVQARVPQAHPTPPAKTNHLRIGLL